MTVRAWFRAMRRQQPPSLELQEFLRTFGRSDSQELGLEREVLFRVALEQAGVVEPDHPNALTLHRLALGSCLICGSLRRGASRDYQPEPQLVLARDEPELVPLSPLRWEAVDWGTDLRIPEHIRRHLREGDWGDPTPRE